MLGWQWLGRLWQCRSLSGRCESLPCHCHFAAFRHLPSNSITHLVLSPSCQKPDIIYVFALCKLLGLSQKRGTTMKKPLSHHIKFEGVQSKFRLKTKRQLANDFNMIGASWNMRGDNMNTETAWKQQTITTPHITITDFWAVREESQKVWQACFSRTKSVLLVVATDSLRFVLCGGADHTNLWKRGHKLQNGDSSTYQCTCCSSDSEFTHNANGCQ